MKKVYNGWIITWDKTSRCYIAKKGVKQMYGVNRVEIERLVDEAIRRNQLKSASKTAKSFIDWQNQL